jgi:hypothetical protein
MVFNPDDKWDDGEWQVYTNHLQGDGDEKGDLLYHIPLWEGKKSLSYILPRCHFVTQERAMEEGRKEERNTIQATPIGKPRCHDRGFPI